MASDVQANSECMFFQNRWVTHAVQLREPTEEADQTGEIQLLLFFNVLFPTTRCRSLARVWWRELDLLVRRLIRTTVVSRSGVRMGWGGVCVDVLHEKQIKAAHFWGPLYARRREGEEKTTWGGGGEREKGLRFFTMTD